MPDKTFKERQEHSMLAKERDEKNAELQRQGNTRIKYVVVSGRLKQIQMEEQAAPAPATHIQSPPAAHSQQATGEQM